MRVLALLAVVACASPRPAVPDWQPRTDDPFQAPGPPGARPVVFRPQIDISAIAAATDRRRLWPLTELPSLQPHHDFAMARDLCTPAWGARHKQQPLLVAYAAAWCKLRAGDDTAIAALANLATTAGGGDVQRAARLDVINLVAGTDSARALAKLGEYKLDSDDNLDLLAATYDALDLHEEALRVAAEVRRRDHLATANVRCERILAWDPLDDGSGHRLTYSPAGRSGTCEKRVHATQCAVLAASDVDDRDAGAQLVAVRECFNTFPDDADIDRRASLLVSFFRWALAASSAEWFALAREAQNAIGVAGGEELTIRALDNALRTSSCKPELVAQVADAAARIANLDRHDAAYDTRLDVLRAMTAKRCSELYK